MVAKKLPYAKGSSINRPPVFSGVNYQFWKVRMKIFINSTDCEIWNSIFNVSFVPLTVVNGVTVEKPFGE